MADRDAEILAQLFADSDSDIDLESSEEELSEDSDESSEVSSMSTSSDDNDMPGPSASTTTARRGRGAGGRAGPRVAGVAGQGGGAARGRKKGKQTDGRKQQILYPVPYNLLEFRDLLATMLDFLQYKCLCCTSRQQSGIFW